MQKHLYCFREFNFFKLMVYNLHKDISYIIYLLNIATISRFDMLFTASLGFVNECQLQIIKEKLNIMLL